jgi:hypothetical protein
MQNHSKKLNEAAISSNKAQRGHNLEPHGAGIDALNRKAQCHDAIAKVSGSSV